MSQILPSPAHTVFFVTGLNGVTEFVSEGILPLSGYRPEELVGRPWWPTLFPDIHWRFLQNSLESNGLHGPLELALTRKDQTRVKTLWNISVRQGQPGCLEGIGTAAEASECEEPLNPDTSYRSLFENNQAAMLLIDPETGAILDGNHAALHFYGYSWEQIRSKHISDLNMLSEEQVRAEMQPAKQEERAFLSVQHRLAGGEIRDVEAYSGPIQMGSRTVLCAIIQDVTGRKQSEIALAKMEQEMRRARDFYLTLFDNFPALIWRIGSDGHDNYFNQTWLNFTGKTLDQELKGGWFEGMHPDDRVRSNAIYSKAFAGRQPFEIEYRLHHHDGTYHWVVDFGRPFNDLDGRFGGYIGTCFDITPQQEMMRSVQESEKRARRLAETLRAIARASQQASALLDLSQLGKKIVELLQGITGCYCSLLFLYLDGQLVISAEHSQQDERKVPDGYAIQIGQGIIGTAAATGQAQNVADVQKHPQYMPWQGFPDTRSELAVPIRSANRLLGVIDMQSEKLGGFDELDMETLSTLADQLAVTIENARIFEELHERTEELAGLAQVSTRLREAHDLKAIFPILLQETMRLLKGKGAVLGLLDPVAKEIRIELGIGDFSDTNDLRLSLETSIQGRALTSGKAVVIDNVFAHPEFAGQRKLTEMPARVGVPFKAYNRAIGTVLVGRERPFLPSEVRLITAIAEIAANAIHRESAHEETVKSLKMLTALNRVATAINQTLESRPVLDLLLEEIHERLPVLAARIFIYDPVEQALNFAGGSLPNTVLVKRDGLEDGPTGRVARERRALLIPDLRNTPGLNPYLASNYSENSRAVEPLLGYYGVPLIAKGQVKGVLEIYYNGRVGEEPDVKNFMDTLAGQAATAIDNAELLDHLRRTNAELVGAYDSTIEGWSHAMDLRDKETEGHTQRVTGLALELAREMGLYGEDLVHMRRGALLHDIGKMGIPDHILLKPGPLTDEEWIIMKQHPQLAFDMLEPIPFLRDALDIPYNHHERWDGTGYPRGLKGKAIPRAARIFAVVDVWDALSSDRPYREAWPRERVYAYIAQASGTHFDPRVVEVFLDILKEKDLDAKIRGWQGE